MSAHGSSAEFGMPEYEPGGEFEQVGLAMGEFREQCQETLEIVADWLGSPQADSERLPSFKVEIEKDCRSLRKVVAACSESDMSELTRLTDIDGLLIAAKQKRMEFFAPLLPDLVFPPYTDHEEVFTALAEEIVEEETDESFLEDQGWQLINLYGDDLRFDLEAIRNRPLEEDEEEAAEGIRELSTGFVKLTLAIVAGNLITRAIVRRLEN